MCQTRDSWSVQEWLGKQEQLPPCSVVLCILEFWTPYALHTQQSRGISTAKGWSYLSWVKPPLWKTSLGYHHKSGEKRVGCWTSHRKYDLRVLPVLNNCSQVVQSFPWVWAQLFYFQDETSPGRSLQSCVLRSSGTRETEILWFQQLLDNIRWCAWGGKPQSVYVPRSGQLSAEYGAGCITVMWRAVDTEDYGITIEGGTTPSLMWCEWGLFAAERDRHAPGPGLPGYMCHCQKSHVMPISHATWSNVFQVLKYCLFPMFSQFWRNCPNTQENVLVHLFIW